MIVEDILRVTPAEDNLSGYRETAKAMRLTTGEKPRLRFLTDTFMGHRARPGLHLRSYSFLSYIVDLRSAAYIVLRSGMQVNPRQEKTHARAHWIRAKRPLLPAGALRLNITRETLCGEP